VLTPALIKAQLHELPYSKTVGWYDHCCPTHEFYIKIKAKVLERPLAEHES